MQVPSPGSEQVSVLLVSHNGARWLPAVVAGVEQQTARIDHHVAIDSGSRDESVSILRRNGIWDVQRIDGDPAYGLSVRAGLDRLPPIDHESHPGWVWLLHDDSSPDPRALEALLAASAAFPDVAVLGPKLREWPSLRRLLEMGVTISGTGRRETGLERGEYDQGQHDRRRVVLAVNTAGMLVRRDVIEQLGFDRALPVYGNDIDFGWRAARAGYSTMVVPEAVVFHAEAAHRGQRESRLSTYHHRQERAAAIYTLLANGSRRSLALQALRLGVIGLLRALGNLLIRAPLEARDELVALGSTLGRPARIAQARRSRATTATVGHDDVRHLLAPPWLPIRHLLDNAADLGSALVDVGRERVGGRSVRTAHSVHIDDAESATEPGLLRLVLANPRTWLVVGSFVLALVAGRDLLTGGPLHGGALSAAPSGTGHWWSLWASANHRIGIGSDMPAPAYVLPLAVAGILTLGHAAALVWVLFVLAVPLTSLSALRFFHRTVPGPVAPYFGAAAYAVLPVATGAVAQGRIGTVVGTLVLAWVATSALGLRRGDRDRRWRSVWRTAVGLALLCAFVPSAWFIALLLLGGLLVHGLVTDRERWRRASWWSGPLVVLVAVPVLLLPWFVGMLGTPGAFLVEAGRPATLLTSPSVRELLLGRSGGPGNAPLWLGAGVVLAAVLAGLRAETRSRVALAWAVSACAALVLAWTSLAVVHLPGVAAGFHPWAGFPLVVVHAGLVTAAVLAGDGLLAAVRSEGPLWRRPVAALGAAVALVGVVGGIGWWVVVGATGGDGPLDRGPVSVVPGYMSDLSATDPANGVIVLKGGRVSGVTYQVFRNGALPLGDDTIAALTPPDPRLTSIVSRLLSDSRPLDARMLASYGVAYVYAPAPTSIKVAAAFDAGAGFSRASATSTRDASWRLQYSPNLRSTRRDGQPFHVLLVLLQALAVVSGVVLTLPTRKAGDTP